MSAAPRSSLKPLPGADRILAEVAARHKVSPAAILGNNREHFIAVARFEVAYRLRKEYRHPFARIAAYLGRDSKSIRGGIARCHLVQKKTGAWPVIESPKRRTRFGRTGAGPNLDRYLAKERKRAEQINSHRRKFNINANARVERDGDRFVIRSDVKLVEARA